jgi:hypothetical protein
MNTGEQWIDWLNNELTLDSVARWSQHRADLASFIGQLLDQIEVLTRDLEHMRTDRNNLALELSQIDEERFGPKGAWDWFMENNDE